MGMILGHHIPGRLGPAPASDSCSFGLKSDDPTPEPFSSPGGSRRDVRFRPDGLRAWTHWTITVGGFDTHQYDLPAPWQLTGWTPSGDILRNTGLNRSMTWHDNGTKLTFLSRWFSSFRRVDTFDHSAAPYDISGGLGAGLGAFTGLTGPGEYMARFSLDGFFIFIDTSGGPGTVIQRYAMTTAHDITSITGVDQLFIFGAFVGQTNTWDFSTDHTRIYFKDSANCIASMDLTAPDDISAPFNHVTGPDTDLPSNLQVARGLTIRPDTGDIIMLADQNNQRIRCWSGGVAPTDDADFSDVVLLLDFAGPDGGTNITDLSPSGHTETFLGDAEIDVSIRSLGENTLLLDGTGDAVTFPDSADWDFGTGDFTVEINMFSSTGFGTDGLISTYDVPTTTNGWWLQLQAGNLRFGVADTELISRPFVFLTGFHYHLSVSRVGTDLRMFIDGNQQGAAETDSTNISGSTRELAVGMLQAPNVQPFTGNLGSVRVTKGTGRYTASFTPPACFYPNQGAAPSPVVASGSPMITRPTSAGAANVQAAAGLGFVFTGITPLFTQGNGNIPPGPYNVGAPGPSLGDLLVLWVAMGPGYPGQSNIDVREGDFPVGFQQWSTTGGISIIDPVTGRSVITIRPRIATGDILDDAVIFGAGPFPVAAQMACFTNTHANLATITADNESLITIPDVSLHREDAPASGFDHLLDVWATAKQATPFVVGATTGGDPAQPTIVVGGAFGYLDNGFGDGMSGVFGYRITPSGAAGVPIGNWSMDILESVKSFAVSARWKSADS